MAQSWRSWGWKLAGVSCLAIGGAIAYFGDCALAQIAPDGILPNNSIVTPQGNTSRIEGGTTEGSNLFHSFEQFSVPTGGTAYFNNASDIQNIISRVTGKSVSNIDGLIRANANANLFLLNPNGIIFGPNASLNIGGSFVASTASSMKFADGKQFSATSPQTTPLLTISIPIGLQFGANPGSILNQSQATDSSAYPGGLAVQPGKTLALVGGEVVLEGGRLTTAGGRIELGSVADTGLVSLNPTNFGWSLGYEDVQNFQDIQLSQQAVVDVSGNGGGDIQVQSRRVSVSDGSQIAAKTLGPGLGGTLTVTTSDSVVVTGESANPQDYSRLTTRTEGAGAAGNLTITTGKFIVQDGAQVSTGTRPRSTGTGGTLTVRASDAVEVSGASADGKVLSRLTTRTEGTGAAGALTITTGKLIIQAGGQVAAGSVAGSEGSGGSLTVTASESVKVSGESVKGDDSSRLTTRTTGTKDAGYLTITTGKLIVEDGGQVSAGTRPESTGAGGTLTVRASDAVEVSGASADLGVLSRLTTRTEADGAAGDLTITTGKLVIRDGAQVSAGTEKRSTGPGGNLTVNASESVKVIGLATTPDGRFYSRLTTRTEGTGSANNLTINTGKLVIQNGAQVSAGTVVGSSGNGGDLTVNASDSVEVIGAVTIPTGRVYSRLTNRTASAGSAGNLRITTGELIVRDWAEIGVNSRQGSGEAGNLEVAARSIQLDKQATLSARAESVDGGNIKLQVQDLLLLRRNSQISATAGTAQAGGNGGNIELDTPFIVTVPSENSDITANAYEGNGGRVAIIAQGIFGTEFREQETPESSDITASSEFGLAGTVEINTPDVDLSRGLAALPAVPVNTEVVQGCSAGGTVAKSEFIITGRGGLPPNPGDALSTDAVMVDLITLNPEVDQPSNTAVSTSRTSLKPARIVEAQGWAIDANGEVILTANASTLTPHGSWQTPANCHVPKTSS